MVGTSRLRHCADPLPAPEADSRVEIVEALLVLVPQRRDLPGARDCPHPRRSGQGRRPPVDGNHVGLQGPWGTAYYLPHALSAPLAHRPEVACEPALAREQCDSRGGLRYTGGVLA